MALKILIVDDDINTLELLREVLQSMSSEVRCINSSKRALEIIHSEKFDGIVLDIIMPEISGLEIAAEIRKSALNRRTTVVAISGSDDQKTMEAAMAAGATFFLHKPFDRTSLMKRLNSTRGSMLQEQRRFVRIPLTTAVTGSAGAIAVRGTCRDISEGGLCFVATAPLTPGMSVSLAITLDNSQRLDVTAKVLRVSEDCTVGVQFDSLSAPNLELVRTFVRRRLERSGDFGI
ncbi:response regulator receiver protein [Candidatus Koribacter versatilis Ellin345]|uniref:Response regulator receiver protein n=1 Tax=Koribacter versatilis (strain Ellin345) TaxID=204669 RepID=Q1IIM1_KORVE|nr:response regulator [Candidatus Koribacter versatilis]ABF43279.1 response regulator receiver protein [Candidatus Koribacter versatilis Ellin345]